MSALKQGSQWLPGGILYTGRDLLFCDLGKTAVCLGGQRADTGLTFNVIPLK